MSGPSSGGITDRLAVGRKWWLYWSVNPPPRVRACLGRPVETLATACKTPAAWSFKLRSLEDTPRSGRATTKPQVRNRPDRLNDATQNPQRLGTAHLRTWTPGQVRQGHGGQ